MSLRGIIVSVDMWYGSFNLLRNFLGRGMGGVIIMQEHLLRRDPFAEASSFDLTNADMGSESYYEIKGGDGNDSV